MQSLLLLQFALSVLVLSTTTTSAFTWNLPIFGLSQQQQQQSPPVLLDDWKILPNGSLQGESADDGYIYTTSPLQDPAAAVSNAVVMTMSGSRYELGTPFVPPVVKTSPLASFAAGVALTTAIVSSATNSGDNSISSARDFLPALLPPQAKVFVTQQTQNFVDAAVPSVSNFLEHQKSLMLVANNKNDEASPNKFSQLLQKQSDAAMGEASTVATKWTQFWKEKSDAVVNEAKVSLSRLFFQPKSLEKNTVDAAEASSSTKTAAVPSLWQFFQPKWTKKTSTTTTESNDAKAAPVLSQFLTKFHHEQDNEDGAPKESSLVSSSQEFFFKKHTSDSNKQGGTPSLAAVPQVVADTIAPPTRYFSEANAAAAAAVVDDDDHAVSTLATAAVESTQPQTATTTTKAKSSPLLFFADVVTAVPDSSGTPANSPFWSHAFSKKDVDKAVVVAQSEIIKKQEEKTTAASPMVSVKSFTSFVGGFAAGAFVIETFVKQNKWWQQAAAASDDDDNKDGISIDTVVGGFAAGMVAMDAFVKEHELDRKVVAASASAAQTIGQGLVAGVAAIEAFVQESDWWYSVLGHAGGDDNSNNNNPGSDGFWNATGAGEAAAA